jgi:hypothetical protein
MNQMALQNALQTKIGGSLMSGGLVSGVRGTFQRVRATVRLPRLGTESARVAVKDSTGVALSQAFITAFVGDEVPKELWGYYSNGDLKAVLTIAYDETNQVYVYMVSKVCADALSVEFDGAAIGSLVAVATIDVPVAAQLKHTAPALTA